MAINHNMYGVTEYVCRVDESSTAVFMVDPTNTDYQAYLAWLAEGNTPEPWEQ